MGAQKGSSRPTARLFGLLWLLAFSHRLFLQLGSVDRAWPFPVFYEGDAETFYHYALSLLQGQSYDGGVPFHPPLFPLLLSLLHGVFGNPAGNLTLRIVLAALHALHVPLLWILARRFVSPGAALAGALLACWSFGLSLISIAAVSEGLYLVLLLAGLHLFVTLREAKEPSTRHALLFGGLLGLLALTRAEGLGVAFLLLGWGALDAWRRRRRESPGAGTRAVRRTLLPWAAAALLLAMTLAPWTIRNAVTLTRANRASPPGLPALPVFVPTTAYGPLNFALANHAEAPGYFTRTLLTSGLHRGVLDLNDPQHRESFVHGYRQGWTWLSRHPGDFVSLVGRKVELLLRSLRLGWLQWDLPGGLTGTRYPVDLFTPDSVAAIPIHLLLLGAGAWLLATGRGGTSRGGGRAWLRLSAALLGLTLIAAMAFFGYARQGVLWFPFLCVIEGAAVAWLAGAVGARLPRRVRGGRALLSLILLLWIVELAGAFQNRDFIASGETQAGSRMLNRDSIMRLSPKSGSPSLTP